jgi:hypothetical protein
MAGTPKHSYDKAVRDMLAFIARNRVRLKNVSVKQLINEGRRF